MVDVELTELQTKLYDVIKEVEPISKKNLAKKVDMQIRSISSPIKSMLDSGVIVADDYGDFSIGAGVREEDNGGYLSIPEVVTSPIADLDDDQYAPEIIEDDSDDNDLFSEYWQKHPEELVTFHQEEGLDAIKRRSLQAALEITPGVGAKALNSALHWFDIDEDVRRDPTTLMRALEDAGVKHTIVGRVARETFLPEKQYGGYIRVESDVIIDRRRQPARRQTMVGGGRRTDPDPDSYYDEYPEPARRKNTPRNDDDPPWWYEKIMSRLEAPERDEQPWRPREQPWHNSQQPQVILEPVLDSNGNPVPDPDNPGQYIERKLIYDQPAQHTQDPHESERIEQVMHTVEAQSVELSKLRGVLADHETERKINTAIDPLLSKIASLEITAPARKAGLTDDQYRMQTEKEIVQDVTSSVESTVATLIRPVLDGLSEMQKMTAMREILQLEQEDGVDHGTYLKYMLPGGRQEDTITKEHVGSTIASIKNLTKGAK